MIFGRESITDWIGHVDKIFVDGTFGLSPQLFSQVFAILADRSGSVVPICYALLPNKRQATYRRMLELICEAWPQFQPLQISSDFEVGLINAFKETFPTAEINGCFFHLVKNMKVKLSNEGLLKRYNNEPELALLARMIPALAFVPPAALDHQCPCTGTTSRTHARHELLRGQLHRQAEVGT